MFPEVQLFTVTVVEVSLRLETLVISCDGDT